MAIDNTSLQIYQILNITDRKVRDRFRINNPVGISGVKIDNRFLSSDSDVLTF